MSLKHLFSKRHLFKNLCTHTRPLTKKKKKKPLSKFLKDVENLYLTFSAPPILLANNNGLIGVCASTKVILLWLIMLATVYAMKKQRRRRRRRRRERKERREREREGEKQRRRVRTANRYIEGVGKERVEMETSDARMLGREKQRRGVATPVTASRCPAAAFPPFLFLSFYLYICISLPPPLSLSLCLSRSLFFSLSWHPDERRGTRFATLAPKSREEGE